MTADCSGVGKRGSFVSDVIVGGMFVSDGDDIWTLLAVAGVLGSVPDGQLSSCCFTISEKKVWK